MHPRRSARKRRARCSRWSCSIPISGGFTYAVYTTGNLPTGSAVNGGGGMYTRGAVDLLANGKVYSGDVNTTGRYHTTGTGQTINGALRSGGRVTIKSSTIVKGDVIQRRHHHQNRRQDHQRQRPIQRQTSTLVPPAPEATELLQRALRAGVVRAIHEPGAGRDVHEYAESILHLAPRELPPLGSPP